MNGKLSKPDCKGIMPRTFVIGDIHGAYSAFLQCLERSGFDYASDRLICLGDVCDRRPRVKECVDELLKIKNLVMILGNHDHWALEWMEGDEEPDVWLMQGGSDTVSSYFDGVPGSHFELFKSAKYFHIENNKLFVHGGIDHRLPINIQNPQNFLWDRSLVNAAIEMKNQDKKLTEFTEVYVGHTPTISFPIWLSGISKSSEDHSDPASNENQRRNEPLKLCNVWLMDTGAGWPGGRLSMMDLDTKDVFQSETIP